MKPNCSCLIKATQMLYQDQINGTQMEKDDGCSPARHDASQTSPPCSSSLCHLPFPGSKHLDKRNLFSPAKHKLFISPQRHGWFPGVGCFILRNWGRSSFSWPQSAPFCQHPKEIATNNLQRWVCSLVTHARIICGIWDLQCFSKAAHSFYSKLRFHLILV